MKEEYDIDLAKLEETDRPEFEKLFAK